jgi:outer membrane protein
MGVIFIVFLCLACPFGKMSFAQDVQRISYQDALQMALVRNSDVKRAENDAEYRGVVVSREYMDFLPSLDVSNRGTRTFGRSFSQEEGTILSETSDFYALEANANLELFRGFEGLSSLGQAKKERDASQLWAARVRQEAVFNVVDRFATLLQNQELARGRAQELKAQEDLLSQVAGLVKVGRRPNSDLFQQQAAQAEAEVLWLAAQRDVALAEMELIRLLHLDPTENYEYETSSFPDLQMDEADSISYEAVLEEALEKRLDVQAVSRTVEARRYETRVAKSGYWPRLSLRYRYGSDWSNTARQPVLGTGSAARTITITPDDGGAPATFDVPGSRVDPDFFQPNFSDQLKDRRGGSIQLSLDIPVFDRFETRTRVKAAQVDLASAQYDLEDLQKNVALQVRRAVLDYQSAHAQWQASQKRLLASNRARDAAEKRYELGAATFVELAQAISGYVGARSAEVRARYATVRARELIRYQTGRLEVPLKTP